MYRFDSSRHYFRSIAWKFRYYLLGAFGFESFWAIQISLKSYFIKQILDHISLYTATGGDMTGIWIYAAQYIALYAMWIICFPLYDGLNIKLYPTLLSSLQLSVMERLLYQGFPFFKGRLSGRLSTQINDFVRGSSEALQTFVEGFFSYTLALLVACWTLSRIHWMLGTGLLVGATLFLILSIAATRRVRLLSFDLSTELSHLLGHQVDCFNNISTLFLFSHYWHEKQLYKEKVERAVGADRSLRKYLLRLNFLQGILSAAMGGGSLVLLIFLLHMRQVTVGDFALVLSLITAITDILWKFWREIAKFSKYYGQVTQGLNILKETHPPLLLEALPGSAEEVSPVQKGEIEFKNLTFSFEGIPLFSALSIRIAGGEKVGLVGYSGSGKTTLVNLLLGIVPVNPNTIFIGGKDINQLPAQELSQLIAVIPQEPALFHRSIMDNIRYGRLDATDEEVYAAAQQAYIHDVILSFPNGYQTIIGEKGIRLSGGQKQRIAIARAILKLKTAPILILDEATSALDAITESLIQHILVKVMAEKATLVIAHRLQTLRAMNRIFVLNEGKIVQEGPHSQLIQAQGLYQTLWEQQTEGFIGA